MAYISSIISRIAPGKTQNLEINHLNASSLTCLLVDSDYLLKCQLGQLAGMPTFWPLHVAFLCVSLGSLTAWILSSQSKEFPETEVPNIESHDHYCILLVNQSQSPDSKRQEP